MTLRDTAMATAPRELEVHAPGETGWLTPQEVAALTPKACAKRCGA